MNNTDYSQGKIYKLVSPNHNKVYIGSTIQNLEIRFSEHKSHRESSSTEIIDAGDATIILIEPFPCLDKWELEDRESVYQLADWDGCVNKQVAGALRRAGGRQAYKKANREKTKEHNKTYREANKEKRNKKCNCFCGGKYIHNNKTGHLRTKKHLNFIEIISMI